MGNEKPLGRSGVEKKLSEKLKDVEQIDFDSPSFGELCKKNYPTQWKIANTLMWLIFIGFIAVSVFNNYMKVSQAREILLNGQEVSAQVIDSIQILEDGKYTDYSVDLKAVVDSEEKNLSLEIPEKVFEENYVDAKEIEIIYLDSSEFNIRSHYERRTNMFSNWVSILFGYLVVFIIIFLLRNIILKVLCSKTGE